VIQNIETKQHFSFVEGNRQKGKKYRTFMAGERKK
jgi:hypothetical protein